MILGTESKTSEEKTMKKKLHLCESFKPVNIYIWKVKENKILIEKVISVTIVARKKHNDGAHENKAQWLHGKIFNFKWFAAAHGWHTQDVNIFKCLKCNE